MSDYVKIADGIIVCRGIDPQSEFRYDDQTEYDAQLVKEIAALQKIVDSFSNGESNEQMIVIDGKYPDDVKASIEKHNLDIGYTGALSELTEKQELLECLRNG